MNEKGELIQIGAGREQAAGKHGETDLESPFEKRPRLKGNLSRRSFLKVLGAAGAAGAVGCADSAREKVLPFVEGNNNIIPGEDVWFRSTCTQCTAGCGIEVRVYDGRALKIEGNRESPVNQGGLCALGQSGLQELYDPDRVRQPLRRVGTAERGQGQFEPISWDVALAELGKIVEFEGRKTLISSQTSRSLTALLNDWCAAAGVDRVSYELLDFSPLADASESVFGERRLPLYRFNEADVVVSLGADFLETWVSPVEFARGWAQARKGDTPLKFVHVEPRLSLTAANADLWLTNTPGSELDVARFLLKEVLTSDKIPAPLNSELETELADVTADRVAQSTGISVEKLRALAATLRSGSAPLVVAGGAAGASENSLALQKTVLLLNVALGAVGKTVLPGLGREVQSSYGETLKALRAVDSGEIPVVFFYGTNALHGLPTDTAAGYALKKAQHVVAFSTHIDETSCYADLILPPHTSLEDWGDHEVRRGVLSLQQPVMLPVFDSRSFGDLLIQSAPAAKKDQVSKGSKTFQEYVQARWQELHDQQKRAGTFEEFWRGALQRGGLFDQAETVPASTGAPAIKGGDLRGAPIQFGAQGASANDPVLYPFFSVKSFDGRAANRPWLQELPDPVAQRAWDSWVEMHPDTAVRYDITAGDLVTLRNYFGELNVPVLITPHVAPNTVAVPVGQGHRFLGRYAKQVEGNPISLLPVAKDSVSPRLNLVAARVAVKRAPIRPVIINAQGGDYQLDRGLAQTALLKDGKVAGVIGVAHHGAAHGPAGAQESAGHETSAKRESPEKAGLKGSHANGHEEGHGASESHEGGHGAHHHEPKQMYLQREHPLYRWGMAIDLAACTGCSACVVACYAENNLPVVGKRVMHQGRAMSWLRIERYYDGSSEDLTVSFLPMLCQHCNNAPCEPVCPVYATYHTEEGLNAMVYNRCVGTRYCSNNCSYKVRRFNWFEFEWPEPLTWQLNPDVVKRSAGVMEKCTFCVQRINAAKDRAKDEGRMVRDGEVQPACVQSCPSRALVFGNLKDEQSEVSKISRDKRAYKVLDHHLNTQPSISYLQGVKHAL